jgi:hypothetical protein
MFRNWLVSSCGLAVTCKREIKLNLRKNGHSLSVLQLASFYSLYKLVQALTSPEKNSVVILMALSRNSGLLDRNNGILGRNGDFFS